MDAVKREIETIASKVRAMSGYMLNAKIDLETGAKKSTAIATIEGGLRVVTEAGAALTRLQALLDAFEATQP